MENIRSVAVIGAGISGVCSAAHLLKHGLDVVLFERSSAIGGVWHLDHRTAHEPPYPNGVPSSGDYRRISFSDADAYGTPPHSPDRAQSSSKQDGSGAEGGAEFLRIAHAPPGPCYKGLKNNVSLASMKTSLGDWPDGLEEFVSQQYLEEYIQDLARSHGVNDIIRQNTRVEDIRKVRDKWRVCTTRLDLESDTNLPRLTKHLAFFDAIVVASGHYHMPRIPQILGLQNWKSAFPYRVSHSKGYRDPQRYRNCNVLIVGAGVSSMDIAKEIHDVGGSVYQSSRGGTFDLPASSLPSSAKRISGVRAFVLEESSSFDPILDLLGHPQPIPGRVICADGSEISNIHHVILATGYITSYPFLADKHLDDKTQTEAGLETLVTKEGDMVHNLHKDIFYIEDPTLAFVGVPYHISTFSLFDFQAQVVARVFASKADMPTYDAMREEYRKKVELKGLGREFHSLRATGAEVEYVKELVQWMNFQLPENVAPMVGHTPQWLVAHRMQREVLAKRLGGKLEEWVPRSLLSTTDSQAV